MKLIGISDLHFGNKRIESVLIQYRLYKYLFPKLENERVFLIITGDIFDNNLSLSNIDTHVTIEFFLKLFDLLEKNNSILRIVRGTYHHDRNQINALVKLCRSKDYTFDFKYFDTIKIEHLDELDLNLLYLPDDLPFDDSSSVLKFVKQLMSRLSISKVDYVFGHGNFKHAFPFNLRVYPKITYEIDQFKDIVRKYILFGHIHVPSHVKNMIYIGSFDRLIHGEKYKKGYFIIDDIVNPSVVTFIENKNATVFKDFKYNDNIELNENLAKLTKLIERYFKQDNREFLRIFDVPVENRFAIRNLIKNQYPNIVITFSKSTNKDKDEFVSFKELILNDGESRVTWSKQLLLEKIRNELLSHQISISPEELLSFFE